MSALIKVFAGGYEYSIDNTGFVATIHNSARAVVIAAHQGNCVVFLVVGVWLDDPRDFTSFNSVFAKYFAAHPPARATVQSALMVDAKVEMDVVAYKPV